MKALISTIFLTGLLSLSGCTTSPPTFGNRVLAEGESRIEIAEQWEQGQKESIAGEKKVRTGQELVEEGRSYLREGEQLIALGNVEVKTNRQAYQALSQTAISIDSGEAALEKVSKLKEIAKEWEDGEEKISEGNKLIQRGNVSISEGESEIGKGQELIVRGRDKMQDAESRYQ
jgi:hypothetical protein